MSNPVNKTRTRTKKGHHRLTPNRFKVVKVKRAAKVEERLVVDLTPPAEPTDDESFMRI